MVNNRSPSFSAAFAESFVKLTRNAARYKAAGHGKTSTDSRGVQWCAATTKSGKSARVFSAYTKLQK